MIAYEFNKLKSLLDSFLGNSKGDLNDSLQLQYPCPKCRADYGSGEDRKYNLELNLGRGKFNCWKCSSSHDEMHGSLPKLIKLYGSDTLLQEYYQILDELRQSDLYKLGADKGEYTIGQTFVEKEDVKLPVNYRKLSPEHKNPTKAIEYLSKRNIDWDIISDFNLGYTFYDENNKQASSRIIIPSFNQFGELNYWTGRDFSGLDKRQKYFNPKVERKNIIFNEDKVQWDADITLVEGPFDHIVVPNSIPLLGKSLNQDFKLYQALTTKANANINIFLDGDAYDNVLSIYRLLNHDRLYGKIRYIPVGKDYDPSVLYELGGHKAILDHLRNAYKIEDIYLH